MDYKFDNRELYSITNIKTGITDYSFGRCAADKLKARLVALDIGPIEIKFVTSTIITEVN